MTEVSEAFQPAVSGESAGAPALHGLTESFLPCSSKFGHESNLIHIYSFVCLDACIRTKGAVECEARALPVHSAAKRAYDTTIQKAQTCMILSMPEFIMGPSFPRPYLSTGSATTGS